MRRNRTDPMTNPPPKETGRTMWDFLVLLWQDRTAQNWIKGIAILVIVATAAGLTTGRLKVEGFAGKSSTAQSPTVEFAAVYARSSLEQCGNAARDELAVAGPTKLLPLLEENRVTSNFAVFGSLNAWVSCVEVGELMLVYVGAAGEDGGEADSAFQIGERHFVPPSNARKVGLARRSNTDATPAAQSRRRLIRDRVCALPPWPATDTGARLHEPTVGIGGNPRDDVDETHLPYSCPRCVPDSK
jgi:hypothetical protein